ncbi:M1 family metallopeptidase [Flavobacterium lacus]|uniref:Peptidase M1-like protein n=1 Tax=Flavobacterium lacus TaxID=1353778 RepID=A0A328WSL3_9FLAO|nr:M1 family metallopeptidase [Flavobacterium lacus]RAR46368.1 peptidase M1-like protein [Flavobacterium lacus]
MNRIIALFLLYTAISSSQTFTRRDTLQGSLRPERTAFDVQRYDLNLTIDPDNRTIVGFNDITVKIVENSSRIQLDLFENMKVDSIFHKNIKLTYEREMDAVFIDLPPELPLNSEQTIRFYYSGKPMVAKRAPWDGGFVWKKDSNGNHFVGVAVQGTGASLWYPVKDHQSDEPDRGASVRIAVPNGLMNVSNGRFLGKEALFNGYTRWDWEVKSPINNYNIVINIADYVHIQEELNGLDLDYYVLRENEEIARKHFEEVKPMMNCFQEKFGAYPFVEDGFKLVETPYLGMEHQSAVAYGNKYMKGYLGNDMTGTGIGLLFDYITIHETGHEWFGNSITSKDIADMWIHESFTTYSESVFVECQFGYEKAMEYINGQKRMVGNQKPIIGQFGVNYKTGNSDMYYKGALLLNTIRHMINDDDKWWKLLRNYAETYRHQIIETSDVVEFFTKESTLNLAPVFDQYLNYKNLPELEFRLVKKSVEARWNTDAIDFQMPIEFYVDTKKMRVLVSNNWVRLPSVKEVEEIELVMYKMLVNVKK